MGGFEEEVFGFQVSMDDILGVDIGDCAKDLLHDVDSLFFAECLFVDDFFEQFATGAQLRDDEDGVVVEVDFDEFDDVWVV